MLRQPKEPNTAPATKLSSYHWPFKIFELLFCYIFFSLLLVDQVLRSSLILSQLLRQAESNSSITKVRIIQRMLWVHSFSPNQSFVNFWRKERKWRIKEYLPTYVNLMENKSCQTDLMLLQGEDIFYSSIGATDFERHLSSRMAP